jgi:dienelactone hydrolase
MAEVVLFHHVLGLTPGVTAFADRLRADGHTVHTPDLFEGKILSTIDEGIAHAKSLGDTVDERARAAVADLPSELVYAGFSMGAAQAQALAQSRPGARGALILHDALKPEWFDSPWPNGLGMQMHVMENDDFVELDVARELEQTLGAELYVYPGDQHLFTDSSTDAYDEAATALVVERALAFLQAHA